MMPDYKEMYLKMMRASEAAIRMSIAAQQECEELYLNGKETPLILLPTENEEGNLRESNKTLVE